MWCWSLLLNTLHFTWLMLICLSCMWKYVCCGVRRPMTVASSPTQQSSRSAAARRSSTGIIGFGRWRKTWRSCWQKSTCQVSLLTSLHVNLLLNCLQQATVTNLCHPVSVNHHFQPTVQSVLRSCLWFVKFWNKAVSNWWHRAGFVAVLLLLFLPFESIEKFASKCKVMMFFFVTRHRCLDEDII